jgi:uridine kinase
MLKFVGLDGGQGSGKTTYATHLIKELQKKTDSPVLYIETDDFLSERESREHLDEDFFRNFANRRKLWDFERMGDVLYELKHSVGKTVTIDGLYNRKTGMRDRIEEFDVHNDSIFLVGGPYLLEPETRPLFSHLIFLNVPKEIRRERVVKRNLELGGSKERALTVFRKFDHFYSPYWNNRMGEYSEIVEN